MTLSKKLTEIRDRSKRAPKEILNIMDSAALALKESDLLEGAVKVGDTIKDHVFLNHQGDEVSLSDYKKKLVITIYRGHW